MDKDIDVKEIRNDWALALMDRGVIVKITMNRWRGTASLSYDELGLKFHNDESKKVSSTYLKLGQEKLLPPEIEKKIMKMESRVRTNLKVYSFYTSWGYFVPYTAFDAWEKENEKLKKEYYDLAHQIGVEYPQLIQTVRNAYTHVAFDVWNRLYPGKGTPTDSFVSSFTNKIIDKIPSRLDIVSSFKFDITYFVIPMPSIMADDISKTKEILRKDKMEDFKIDVEMQTRQKVANEYIKRKQELIDGFLESTVCEMRSQISRLCNQILLSLSNPTKEISRAHLVKIKQTIEKLELLNFYNDKDIDGLLKNLDNEVGKFKGERNQETITSILEKIVSLSEKELVPSDFNYLISSIEL